jgi:hypothetical protein
MNKLRKLNSQQHRNSRMLWLYSVIAFLFLPLGAVQASASNASPGAYVDGEYYDYQGLVEFLNAPTMSQGFAPLNVQVTPTINWTPETPIAFRHPLGEQQINALAVDPDTNQPVPGTYVYDPDLGDFLSPGTYSLSLIFVPEDTVDYEIVQVARTIVVSQRVPNIVWEPTFPDLGAFSEDISEGDIFYGVPLDNGVFNAVAYEPEYPANPNLGGWEASDGESVVIDGIFFYSEVVGEYLDAGEHTIFATFEPDTAVIAPDSGFAFITVEVAKAPTFIIGGFEFEDWSDPTEETYEFVFTAESSPLDAVAVYPYFILSEEGEFDEFAIPAPAEGSIAYYFSEDPTEDLIGIRPNAGEYEITAEFTGDSNFEDTIEWRFFTVNPKEVVITFNSLAGSYLTVDGPITLTATTDANPSEENGDDVPLVLNYSIDSGEGVAVTSGGLLTFPG